LSLVASFNNNKVLKWCSIKQIKEFAYTETEMKLMAL